MQWSAKEGSLIESQYAPVAPFFRPAPASPRRRNALDRAAERGVEIAPLLDRFADRARRAALMGKDWAALMFAGVGVDDLRSRSFI